MSFRRDNYGGNYGEDDFGGGLGSGGTRCGARRKAGGEKEDAPKRKTSYTLKLTDAQIKKLGEWCSRHLWVPFPVEYSVFAYKDDNVNVVAYTSGKIVVAGRGTEEFVTNVLEPEITLTPQLGYDEVLHPEWFEDHAGLDESGKGDLFGPLVTACVIATGDMISSWRDSGVRDSKTVTSDAAIFAIERQIRQTPGVIIKVMHTGMEKYNRLYHQFGDNLNKLLAWYHATGLADCLPRFETEHGKPCPRGLLDQFTETPLVQRELKKHGITFDLAMRTKAESDPVVAAASIVARAAYVRELVKLSREAGETLPKGSGANAKEAGIRIVEKFGPDAFGRFAKLHFRTAWECRGLTPPRPKFVFKRKSAAAAVPAA